MPRASRTINNLTKLTFNKKTKSIYLSICQFVNLLTVQRKTKGFTLIELLTVITIIGILVTIAVASYSTAQTKGRDSRRKTDLDTIKKALELAKIDSPGQYYYPSCPSGASTCQISNTTETIKYDGTTPNPLHPTYTPSIPTDPKTKNGYFYATIAANGSTPCTTNCPNYQLTACLENKNDPQKDTTHNATACPNSGATAGTVSFTIKPN